MIFRLFPAVWVYHCDHYKQYREPLFWATRKWKRNWSIKSLPFFFLIHITQALQKGITEAMYTPINNNKVWKWLLFFSPTALSFILLCNHHLSPRSSILVPYVTPKWWDWKATQGLNKEDYPTKRMSSMWITTWSREESKTLMKMLWIKVIRLRPLI